MTRANIVLAMLSGSVRSHWSAVSIACAISPSRSIVRATLPINSKRERNRAVLLQSRLSTPTIVERTARDRLGMDLPEGSRTQLVELGSGNAAAQ